VKNFIYPSPAVIDTSHQWTCFSSHCNNQSSFL